MFKKIGKNVPDHHLLFFSSVLTVLFFVVLFNPVYSPVIQKEVVAASGDPVVTFLTPSTTGFFATSSSSIIITGTSIASGSLSETRWTDDNWLTSDVTDDKNNWTINITSLKFGANIIAVKSRKGVVTTYATTTINRLPENGELIGYAWADTIGWISLSSRNCDSDLNGFSDGLGDCPPEASSTPRYFTQIAPTTGHLSGYAWSENVGWISFQHDNTPDFALIDPPEGSTEFNGYCYDDGVSGNDCTESNNCIACYNSNPVGYPTGTGRLYGWANVLSLGDDGWISLSSSTAPFYGVGYDVMTNQFSGYAWSGANSVANAEAGLGWLSYSSKNCDTDGDGFSNGADDCPVAGTPIPDYKVMAALNMPPTVAINETAVINELPCGSNGTDGACSTNCELKPVLRWDYDDPEGFDQKAYQVVLKNSIGGTIGDTGKVISTNKVLDLVTINPGPFTYNTQYTVDINVWDNFDLISIIPATKTFTTDLHDYPEAFFDWFIEEGSAQEEILFWDQSIYHQDNSNTSSIPGHFWYLPETRLWWTTISEVVISDSALATTTAIYPFEGMTDMTLDITDNVGMCSTSTSLDINKKLPSWIEVR